MNYENNEDRKDASKHSSAGRVTALFLCGVIAIAVVGYFVGVNDGAPREDLEAIMTASPASRIVPHGTVQHVSVDRSSMPATTYSEMRRRENGPTSHWTSSLGQIPQPEFDLMAEVKPDEQAKLDSTATRASRRAFNGAPPIIPHSVQQTDDAACYACHGNGLRIGDKVANQMSHEFLANCTQCHAVPPPKPFAKVDASVQNSFVGLPAPLQGKRAFPGAPPTIPHSTWMRKQCLACHGTERGWAGLESTHPWRINCQQCHAPSADLEQGVTVPFVPMLPPLVVDEP